MPDVGCTMLLLSVIVVLAWLAGVDSAAGWWPLAGVCLCAAALAAQRVCAVLRWRRLAGRLWRGVQELRGVESCTPIDASEFTSLSTCAQWIEDVARDLRHERTELTETATRDALTGLANRGLLMETIKREVADAKRTGWPLGCIVVDLDHFKTLNDTHGHQAGDLVLQRTSARLASLVRDSDLVARYGGEEFVVLLPRATLTKAVALAQELCNAVRCSIVTYRGQRIQVTASFGVCELHECGVATPDGLIAGADVAMYDAKAAGRDQVAAAVQHIGIHGGACVFG